MQQGNEKTDWLYALLLYGLGFLLFWEWLRPLSIISDTGQTEIFILFTAFLFLLSYFQLPFWLSFPIKGVALIYALHAMFFPGPFFESLWIDYFLSDFSQNVDFLFDGSFDRLSNVFRTFLFFILLWLISYLMQYWLIQTRRIFLFLLVTIVYISVIDTFTTYQADNAIIRIVIIGFVLLGLLQILRIQEQEGVIFSKGRFPVYWLMPLVVVIAFSSIVGYIAPKAEPQWPDPVPFLKKTTGDGDGEGRNGNGISKIGYGEDDSQLGGPFVMDDTAVFTAQIKDRGYWRVETKDVYTGKGWESSVQDRVIFEGSTETLFEDGVELEAFDMKMNMTGNEKFDFIVHPGQVTNIETGTEVQLLENPLTGKVFTQNLGESIVLDNYNLDYESPTFSEKMLREAPVNYPDRLANTYLQLPETLPERVSDLAEEITVEEENSYDKARAIENYFVGNGFVYETTDVAVPGENDDYVDQFLFETQLGYCDNFSSSMTVLLRSLGIPARWVKGFTEGEFVATAGDYRKYEVTNNNAHSWVEAYFPGVGWVPFEPTRGFTNQADFVSDYSDDEATNSEAPDPAQTEEEQAQQQEQTPEEQASSGSSSVSFEWTVWYTVVLVLILLLLGYVVFKNYKKWLKRLVISRYKRRDDGKVLSEAYFRLLWLLELHGIKRGKDQTLREYAVQVDSKLQTEDMKELTRRYEENYYRGKANSDGWDEMKELWENLIKKMQS
ncbi:transglutaminaseTgpA domain-containing protein [Anaerobacillus sp. 1_MG-2023]|uniref:transglutaminase TgpA family protein n=1 Tax=Anaerobacillus sp. 1_MG-2023 TaxID=3062655 RepID=UPI0026E14ACE|nr:transglutaminaseTgpA domain-containing protein [Anaerobacillus sp. 1_MG-2023]MDO6658713.1 transglutaminaseTgpA domain-containing protein [Anaerobacillus sp. 1_MG-2023]